MFNLDFILVALYHHEINFFDRFSDPAHAFISFSKHGHRELIVKIDESHDYFKEEVHIFDEFRTEARARFRYVSNPPAREAMTINIRNQFLQTSFDEEDFLEVDRSNHLEVKAYAKFLNQYQVDKKTAKNIFKEQRKNWPKFLKFLGWEHCDIILTIIESYILTHACSSKKCDDFAKLVCSKCRGFFYCNEVCQREDFKRHQANCDYRVYQRISAVPGLIQMSYSHARPGQLKDIVSYHAFRRNLRRTTVKVFGEIIHHKLFHRVLIDTQSTIEEFLKNKKDIRKCLKLIKREGPVHPKVLGKQMEAEYGKKNFFAPIFKQY